MPNPPDSADELRHMMLTRLRVRHFSLLSAITEFGSIHRAATAHGLSQPGVSKLLKEIETALGLPLFERNSSGTVPTIYGLRATKTFRAIITEIEYLAHELDVIRAGGGGIIRVGVINYVSRSTIAEALLDLWRAKRRFVVHMVNGNTETLIAALQALELDCVIARKPGSKFALETKFTPIYHQEPCLIFQSGTLEPEDNTAPSFLEKMRWILPPRGTPGRLEFDKALAIAGVREPNIIVETSDLDLIYNLVRREAEVCAILPSDLGRELAEKGEVKYRPFTGAFDYPQVGIIELPRVARDPNVDLFCQSVTEVAARRLAETILVAPESEP